MDDEPGMVDIHLAGARWRLHWEPALELGTAINIAAIEAGRAEAYADTEDES